MSDLKRNIELAFEQGLACVVPLVVLKKIEGRYIYIVFEEVEYCLFYNTNGFFEIGETPKKAHEKTILELLIYLANS